MRRRRRNAGFSAAELSLCFLTIATLSILLLVFGQSCRERSRGISCASNLRQLSLATRMYMSDNGGRGPIGDVPPALMPYAKNEQIFVCPSDRDQPTTALPAPVTEVARPGMSPGFRNSYQLATGVRDDEMPQRPIIQDGRAGPHLDRTYQFGRLDGAVRRVPADQWYPLQ